jgi:hypothetical protein
MDNMRRMQREQPEIDPRAGTKTMLGISSVIIAVAVIAVIGAVIWIWLL